MSPTTERALKAWLAEDFYRSVRVEFGTIDGKWHVVGLERVFDYRRDYRVIVSMQSGRTLNAAVRRFMVAAGKDGAK